MQKHLTSFTNPLELAKCLDEIEHDYAQLYTSNQKYIRDRVSGHLYELRQLRNILLKVGGCNLFGD